MCLRVFLHPHGLSDGTGVVFVGSDVDRENAGVVQALNVSTGRARVLCAQHYSGPGGKPSSACGARCGWLVWVAQTPGEELWSHNLVSFTMSSPTLSCDGTTVFAATDVIYTRAGAGPAQVVAMSAQTGAYATSVGRDPALVCWCLTCWCCWPCPNGENHSSSTVTGEALWTVAMNGSIDNDLTLDASGVLFGATAYPGTAFAINSTTGA